MNKRNSCYTYFSIIGNFEPNTISELLNLKPYVTHKIGDLRNDGKTKYEFATWNFGKCDIYDVKVENQMSATIEPLLDKTDILKEIKMKYDVNFVLEVVPTIKPQESTPCLAPSLKVMQFCCDTETDIDIDLYIE